jgi:hypothetical protein
MYYKVEFLFHYSSLSTSLHKRERDKLMEDKCVSLVCKKFSDATQVRKGETVAKGTSF